MSSEQKKYLKKLQKIVILLNKDGLSYLSKTQFGSALQLFRKAEKIVIEQLKINLECPKINQLAAVTYNNLACYYKKTRKPKVALGYLKKALDFEVYKINSWISTASTHLNICAIYSFLNNHEQAANHAQLSIDMLSKAEEEQSIFNNILMISHYNLAIQLQHLQRFQECLIEYGKAKEIALNFSMKNASIIQQCQNAIQRIHPKIDILRKKMLQIINRKKIAEEKGHCLFMRNNKKKANFFKKKLNFQSQIQKTQYRDPSIQKMRDNDRPIYRSTDLMSLNRNKFKGQSKLKRLRTERKTEKVVEIKTPQWQ